VVTPAALVLLVALADESALLVALLRLRRVAATA